MKGSVLHITPRIVIPFDFQTPFYLDWSPIIGDGVNDGARDEVGDEIFDGLVMRLVIWWGHLHVMEPSPTTALFLIALAVHHLSTCLENRWMLFSCLENNINNNNIGKNNNNNN